MTWLSIASGLRARWGGDVLRPTPLLGGCQEQFLTQVNGMNSTAHVLGTLALVSALAGCSSADGTADAGFHYTEASSGLATLSGAIEGSSVVYASASNGAWRLRLPDGGFTVSQLEFVFSSYSVNPSFGCLVYLPTASLQTGTFMAADVSGLSCSVLATDGGTAEFWGNVDGTAFLPPNTFELNISAVGPARFNGTFWPNPTATLTVSLAPYAESGGSVGFSVAVEPPPCPTYCAAGP